MGQIASLICPECCSRVEQRLRAMDLPTPPISCTLCGVAVQESLEPAYRVQRWLYRAHGNSYERGPVPRLADDAVCSCGGNVFSIDDRPFFSCFRCHDPMPAPSGVVEAAQRYADKTRLADDLFPPIDPDADVPMLQENLFELPPGIEIPNVAQAKRNLKCRACGHFSLHYDKEIDGFVCASDRCRVIDDSIVSTKPVRRKLIDGVRTKIVGSKISRDEVDAEPLPRLQDLLERDHERDRRERRTQRVALYKNEDLEYAAARVAGLEKDMRDRLAVDLKYLAESGQERKLSDVRPTFRNELTKLVDNHPNFAAVIDNAIAPAMAIRAAGGHARQPPLLLVGPPGVGKTHFARSLAKMLGVPSETIDMSVASTSSTLSGLATGWGNASTGMLFRLLVRGHGYQSPADPVMVLDELDKCSQREGRTMDPIGSLYGLLEVESAKRWCDEALPGLHLNASHVRWVLCANTTEGIPSPIISRCQVFEISELDDEQKRDLYLRIFDDAVKSCELDVFFPGLPTDILERSLAMGMREFKNACITAIGRAVSDGRFEVSPNDFRIIGSVIHARPKIGFVR